ncbi:DUF4363 family protein [Clostridium cylindrosporum]|uniref:DUF4363 family protein n=1 Tax=Clostridium cylindrosporum DSM 605 TaxID=1121307 RepID=A0A0J8D988_CLOCY|nr:DUF4363 family protein [Clostridium cylindrosporum]KMT20848.1 hypothetical protein CLCY_1c00820 [Clostridium cylindrosporum DSM 605]
MKVNIKTILGLLAATLLLFIGTLWMGNYLNKSSSSMLEKVKKIELNLLQNDLKSAVKNAEELNEEWKELEDKWNLLTNHHEIDNITTSLKNTIEFIKFNDIPNSMANLESLRHYIEHIPEMEKPNSRNIL